MEPLPVDGVSEVLEGGEAGANLVGDAGALVAGALGELGWIEVEGLVEDDVEV